MVVKNRPIWSSKVMHTSCPLSFPNSLNLETKQWTYLCNNYCILHASNLVIRRTIFNSHVFIVMDALDLDGNSSVVFEIDATTCDSYKVDMCIWSPFNFSKQIQNLGCQNCIRLVFPPLQALNLHGIHHPFPWCKIPMLWWMFGPFEITNSNMNIMSPPYMNVLSQDEM